MVYGYLRVSSDKQDVESQKIGVVDKAAELHLEIGEWIADEGVSGVKEYSKRQLGELMKKAKPGDVIIVSEISRLARSVFMLFRIVEFCMENDVVIHSVKDSISTIKKNDLTGIMMVFCFGIAAQIEREMIVKRTVEGLERRRREGVIFGRPVGATSKKKLDGRRDEIQEYLNAGLSFCQTARMMSVNRGTLARFCAANGVPVAENTKSSGARRPKNRPQMAGQRANEALSSERELIVSLMDEGLTGKYIMERLAGKGLEVSVASFRRWLQSDGQLYDYFVEKQMAARAVKNAGCGEHKNYFKF
jgi:DNA invertase Pin-like site-specific DNA recombinase